MKITDEKEVIGRIIKLINELHPVKTPRIDLQTPSFKRPSTDIEINLVENDNMLYTFINILDGTESFKQSVPKGEILTDVFLDTNTLKKLIDYILTNFPIVYSFNVNEYSISINFSFSKNNEFIGKSQGLQISKAMFDWVSDGKSLNKVIESIIENSENKKANGISGYLTNGFYKRDIFDSGAIVSALQSYINHNQSFQQLERRLTK